MHKRGIKTFKRPKGVPNEWEVKITKDNGGMMYIDPKNPHHRIRVMAGNPKSPNIAQRRAYVVHQTPEGRLNKKGKLVEIKCADSHIPLEEFNFKKD